MTLIVSTAPTASGTADSDIIVVQNAGANVTTTVNAGNGNDIVLGDHGPVAIDSSASNVSLVTAMNIDAASLWTTSLNLLLGNGGIPHTTVVAQASGQVDMFKVTLAAGATITLDMDFAYGPYGGPSFDSQIQLLDSGGNILASDDDSFPSDGGLGSIAGPSSDTLDSYLTYTAASAGTYYIKVASYSNYQPIPAGSTYILSVSATGHSATGLVGAHGDILNGGSGDDFLVGNVDADTLDGGTGNDMLYGDYGDDILIGGADNDLIDGGGGFFDTASYAGAASGVTVSLAAAGAQNTGGAGTDTLVGIENLIGSSAGDTLTGDGGDNRLDGGIGPDTLNGGGGDDVFVETAGQGGSAIDGGMGTDTLDLSASTAGWSFSFTTGFGTSLLSDFTVTTSIERVVGTNYGDTFTSMANAEMLGLNGDDWMLASTLGGERLDGGVGVDTLDTTANNTLNSPYAINLTTGAATNAIHYLNFENVISGDTADTIVGSSANNNIASGGGNDDIDGGGGQDILIGGLGDDTLSGGAGDDLLVVTAGQGGDNIDGGADTDTLDLSSSTVGWELDLGTGFASTLLSDFLALSSIEKVLGSNYNDSFTSLANAEMQAFGGDDLIRASTTGGERLDGGTGSDTLDTTASNVLNSPYSINLTTGDATNAIHYLNFENVVSGNTADSIVGTSEANNIFSGGGDDDLKGGGSNDVLEGGDGNDKIDGGTQSDYASYASASAAVTVSLALAGAQNTVGAGSDTLLSIENLRGSAFADTLTGDDGSNLLDGGNGNDTLEGGLGFDTFFGGAGSDTASYAHSAAGVTVSLLLAGGYQDTGIGSGLDYLDSIENLTGSELADTLTGDSASNVLKGGGGDDSILYQGGSAGSDTIDGGAGSDDFLNVSASSFAWTLDLQAGTGSGNGDNFAISNIERVLGSDFDDMLTSRNSVTGTVIDGGLGNDLIRAGGQVINHLDGGAGIDTLDMTGYNVATYHMVNLTTGASNFFGEVLANFENASTGASHDFLIGTSGDNILDAGAGNDTVKGGAGNDTIDGGLGLDWASYEGAAAGVSVSLAVVGAQDTLGAGLDSLVNIENLAGSAFDDTLTGNAGDNRLFGGVGADLMTGGAGNDLFSVDNKDDKVIEAGGEGTDTVESLVDYSIAGQDIEILTLVEGSIAIKGVGNGLNNVITGNANANLLYGGAGADTLVGGLGNDTYYVENVGDTVTEAVGAGGDTVSSSVSFTLGANIERLVLTGAAAINGTGNGLINNITGNGAVNILDGGAGADVMKGAGGNDIYYVDHKDDVTEEAGGGGTDTVYASTDYSVAGQNIENLILTGAAIKGTGNGLANTITGNANANVLYGGGSADTMIGGLGNDTYYVDGTNDIVTEALGEGNDTVSSSGTYVLGANVEVLRLTGSANINGTGNALANTITGNTNANVIDGGAGADTMKGGAGNDSYVVDNAGDTITELSGEGTDSVSASVSHTLAANVENLTLTGASAINGTGNSLANTLNGNAAVNTLQGGGGDDALHGGQGSDTLTGGAGLDSFWFETVLGAGNIDNLTDFAAVDDSIQLDRTIFTGIAANGALAAGAFRLGTVALDADDRILYDQATGNLWYDADGSGASAAVQFAHVVAGTAMTAADFFAVP